VIKAELPFAVQQAFERASAADVVASTRKLVDSREPVVICVVRNERHRFTDFLRHYRTLGIRQFVFVDNGSTDDGRQFLAEQPDVDMWSTTELFSAEAKHSWINKLVDIYGRHRWYALADADEHLVYAESDHQPLADFAAKLSSAGLRQCRGMLVDMYAPGAASASFRHDNETMLDAFPLFDRTGYYELKLKDLTSMHGGPRARAFANVTPTFRPELTKYPLFWPGSDGCVLTPHFNWPRAQGDEDNCRLGILHFKFDAANMLRHSTLIGEGRYWREGFEYKVYRAGFKINPSLSLKSPISSEYKSPKSLVDAGLIAGPIELNRSSSLECALATAYRRHRAQLLQFIG